MPHVARPEHKARHPVHVTLRGRPGLPSFRSPKAFGAISYALAAAHKKDFRLVHFSVQSDHLHLMVEAQDKAALSRGVGGLTTRLARAINRALGRKGPVWGDRYHAHYLTTPTEVRNTLVYILFNFRKHQPADRSRLDACSSAPWFDGFRTPIPCPAHPPPTRPPRTWLAREGWRDRGLIHLHERPS